MLFSTPEKMKTSCLIVVENDRAEREFCEFFQTWGLALLILCLEENSGLWECLNWANPISRPCLVSFRQGPMDQGDPWWVSSRSVQYHHLRYREECERQVPTFSKVGEKELSAALHLESEFWLRSRYFLCCSPYINLVCKYHQNSNH